MLYPDLVGYLPDPITLGIPYTLDTADALAHEMGVISLTAGEAITMRAIAIMRSADNLHYAGFEIVETFINVGGVITSKNVSQPYYQKDNINNEFYFDFTTTPNVIRIMCQSGLGQVCHWKASDAQIKI